MTIKVLNDFLPPAEDIKLGGIKVGGNLDISDEGVLDLKTTQLLNGKLSNCITSIPQHIFLTITSGILTLKAGSKVYVPNGSSTFDTYTTTSDTSYNWISSSFTGLLWLNNTNSIDVTQTSLCFSGSTQPTSSGLWYDTANNLMKFSSDEGVTWTVQKSLPLALVTITAGLGITAINSIFNGFGYIGSTIFALPDIDGLIPAGRNQVNGNVLSTALSTTTVKLFDTSSISTDDTYPLTLSSTELNVLGEFKVEDYASRIPTSGRWFSYYSPVNNYLYKSSDGGIWTIYNGIITGTVTINSGKVTTLHTDNALSITDYNDFIREQNNTVHKTDKETIDGSKTFLASPDIKKTTDDNTVAPSEIQYYQWGCTDKNNTWLGGFEHKHLLDGTVQKGMWVRKQDNSENYSAITVGYDNNQNPYTSAPTPSAGDNSTKIATTAWCYNPTLSTNLLHRNGDETATGTKTFDAIKVANILQSGWSGKHAHFQTSDWVEGSAGYGTYIALEEGAVGAWNKVWTYNAAKVITETYQNGASWYRKWSDGWKEVGYFGWFTNGGTWTFPISFSNTNYVILISPYNVPSSSTSDTNWIAFPLVKSNGNCTIRVVDCDGTGGREGTLNCYACGF